MAEGHTQARQYSVGMVWSEAGFARERYADRASTESSLMLATIAQAIAGGTGLNDALEELRRGSHD